MRRTLFLRSIPIRPITLCDTVRNNDMTRRRYYLNRVGLVVPAILGMASLALGQFPQQAGPRVGLPVTANACQGLSVAVSADGRTAIVGAPGDTGGSGVSGAECTGG